MTSTLDDNNDMISYQYQSPLKKSRTSDTFNMDIANAVSQDNTLANTSSTEVSEYPFPSNSLDLSMLLLGEPKSNFETSEFKMSFVKSGNDLDKQCFIRATMFLVLFTVQGIASRERGAKKKHAHLHMVFHLLYPKTNASIGKMKKFMKRFILGIPSEKIKKSIPRNILSEFSFLNDTDVKKLTKEHKMSLDLISKKTETFSLQAGYMLKDLGRPHFRLFSHRVTKEELCESYKNYMQKVKYEPDSDKEIIPYHALPTNLRKYIFTTFGRKSEIDPLLALYYHIEYGNATLDADFLRQQTGKIYDHARIKSWIRLTSTNSVRIEDLALLAFGDITLADQYKKSDGIEKLSMESYLNEQDNNDGSDDLDMGFSLINGKMPITTDYNDLNPMFFKEQITNEDVAIVYSTMKDCAAKNIDINYDENNGLIYLREPTFKEQNISSKKTVKI